MSPSDDNGVIEINEEMLLIELHIDHEKNINYEEILIDVQSDSEKKIICEEVQPDNEKKDEEMILIDEQPDSEKNINDKEILIDEQPDSENIINDENIQLGNEDIPITIDYENMKLPGKNWSKYKVDDSIVAVKLNFDNRSSPIVTYSVTIENKSATVLLKGRPVRDIALPLFNNNEELEELLHHVDALKPCEGATLGTHGKECRAWVAKKAERCTACKNMQKNLKKKENRAIRQKL